MNVSTSYSQTCIDNASIVDSTPSPLVMLPDEIILNIFSFVSLEDLTSLSLVNRKWHGLSQDKTLWTKLAPQIIPQSIIDQEQYSKTDIQNLIYLRTVRAAMLLRQKTAKTPEHLKLLSEKGAYLKSEEWLQKNLLRTHFKLPAFHIKYLPPEFFLIKQFTFLDLDKNKIEDFPSSFVKMDNLKRLYLGFNAFKKFPKRILKLHNLRLLHLGNNMISSLPEELGSMEKLHTLCLGTNPIQSIPLSLNRKTITIILSMDHIPLVTPAHRYIVKYISSLSPRLHSSQ